MNYWFYMKDNSQQGPISEEKLRELLSRKEITLDTPVWKEGMPEWTAYSKVGELNTNEENVTVPSDEIAICEHCITRFPKNEMMKYEDKYICSKCKPAFVQKLKEGDSLGLGDFVYAGIGRRWVAVFIDGIIFAVINGILSAAIGAATVSGADTGSAAVVSILVGFLSFVVPMLYEIYFIGTKGATLGKMAMGIKVISTNNQPVSMQQSIGRYFAKFLSALILMIGYIMAFFNDENRTLHDGMSETRVVLS